MVTYEPRKDLFYLLKQEKLGRFDGVILCAAIANYIPIKQKGKIPSGKETISVKCTPAPVFLEMLRLKAPKARIIAFKTEEKKSNVQRKTLQLLTRHRLDGAVGNTLDGFGGDFNEIFLLSRKGKGIWKKGKKQEIARFILDLLEF